MPSSATASLLLDTLSPDWADALAQRMPLSETFAALAKFLSTEADSGRGFQPAPERLLAAFARPLAEVRVLIVGQDPYPNPAYPIGLSFAVDPTVRPLPGSLRNIHRELHDDLALVAPAHGDLTAWADRGVMLLNRVLSVRPGPQQAGSHRGHGWEEFTAAAIEVLAQRGGPLVAVLWGKQAAALEPSLGKVPTIVSAHPSPLSARRGFFGSRPFSRANQLLADQGATPINWSLT